MGDERYALGVEIHGHDLRSEVDLMQRMSEQMYVEAKMLRACGLHLAASAVEWGAFHLVNESEDWRLHLSSLRPEATT